MEMRRSAAAQRAGELLPDAWLLKRFHETKGVELHTFGIHNSTLAIQQNRLDGIFELLCNLSRGVVSNRKRPSSGFSPERCT